MSPQVVRALKARLKTDRHTEEVGAGSGVRDTVISDEL